MPRSSVAWVSLRRFYQMEQSTSARKRQCDHRIWYQSHDTAPSITSIATAISVKAQPSFDAALVVNGSPAQSRNWTKIDGASSSQGRGVLYGSMVLS